MAVGPWRGWSNSREEERRRSGLALGRERSRRCEEGLGWGFEGVCRILMIVVSFLRWFHRPAADFGS